LLRKICPTCGKRFETWPNDDNAFCSRKCVNRKGTRRGAKNSYWKGGRTRHSDGYIYVRSPYHPFSSNGYVFEHRLVMERYLLEHEPDHPALIRIGEQKYLSPEWDTHHGDENRSNNKLSNLVAMTKTEHKKLHRETAAKG